MATRMQLAAIKALRLAMRVSKNIHQEIIRPERQTVVERIHLRTILDGFRDLEVRLSASQKETEEQVEFAAYTIYVQNCVSAHVEPMKWNELSIAAKENAKNNARKLLLEFRNQEGNIEEAQPRS